MYFFPVFLYFCGCLSSWIVMVVSSHAHAYVRGGTPLCFLHKVYTLFIIDTYVFSRICLSFFINRTVQLRKDRCEGRRVWEIANGRAAVCSVFYTFAHHWI